MSCNGFLFSEEVTVLYKPLDIEGHNRPEVIQSRNRYLEGSNFVNLYLSLNRGETYRYYIRKRLSEEKLPEFLEYVPVIESSYKPTAMPANGSSVGLWQFMENSMEPFLKKNEWLDERRDPWKSTNAALHKLKDNYNMFGDWLLALAAYNCGAGAVSRALKKCSGTTFWDLCRENLIPLHAQRYVPNLIAVYDLAVNAEYYDVTLPQLNDFYDGYNPYIDFGYITVDGQVYLNRLENELRLQEGTLSSLNLELFRGCTPPGKTTRLRVPSGMEKAVERTINSILNEK